MKKMCQENEKKNNQNLASKYISENVVILWHEKKLKFWNGKAV